MPGLLNACRSAGGILTIDCDSATAKASLLEMTTSRIATTDATHAATILRIDERFGVHITPGPTLCYYKRSCDARFGLPFLGGEMPTILDVAQSSTRSRTGGHAPPTRATSTRTSGTS